MKKTEARVTKLTHFLRILQLIHEVDSVNKIYRMLLSLSTSGSIIGCDRAVLMEVDISRNTIKGILGFENFHTADEMSGGITFEKLAREVFESFEKAESSESTLRAKSFSIPLDCHHSALVKAVYTNYPVLADLSLSEFSNDPFFDFFHSKRYVAIPISVNSNSKHNIRGDRAELVLATDRKTGDGKLDVEGISLLFSLAQQASLAVRNIMERADARRRSRIITKLTRITNDMDSFARGDNGLKFGMSMISRALEASGCLLRDYTKQNTIHVKPAEEHSFTGSAKDEAVASSFDAIMERTAASMKVELGDSGHPFLKHEASVGGFIAVPLYTCGEIVGSMAVYFDKNKSRRHRRNFTSMDKMFLEIGASIMASAIGSAAMQERLKRNEEFLEDVHTNLSRERQSARMGSRSREYALTMKKGLEGLREALESEELSKEKMAKLSDYYERMHEQSVFYLQEIDSDQASFKMINIYLLVKKLSKNWKTKIERKGVEVTLRIPSSSSRLLMDEKSISKAFENILESVGASLCKGDRVLIECSDADDKAIVLIADNGLGLPGDLLTRLFMPFCNVGKDDERKNALSLAGELIHKHGGEISVKSSLGWKTVLTVSFKRAANRERRKGPKDRRSGRRSRRANDKAKNRSF